MGRSVRGREETRHGVGPRGHQVRSSGLGFWGPLTGVKTAHPTSPGPRLPSTPTLRGNTSPPRPHMEPSPCLFTLRESPVRRLPPSNSPHPGLGSVGPREGRGKDLDHSRDEKG